MDRHRFVMKQIGANNSSLNTMGNGDARSSAIMKTESSDALHGSALNQATGKWIEMGC